MTTKRIVTGETDFVKISSAINQNAEAFDTLLPLPSSDITVTTTNDSAAAGVLGQIIESDKPQGSASALTTGVALNVTTISLTAGDWDVSAVAYFHPAGTTTITWIAASLSLVSATLDITVGRITANPLGGITAPVDPTAPIMPCRFSLAATTTVYLVADASFGVSTLAAWGHLRARRVR